MQSANSLIRYSVNLLKSIIYFSSCRRVALLCWESHPVCSKPLGSKPQGLLKLVHQQHQHSLPVGRWAGEGTASVSTENLHGRMAEIVGGEKRQQRALPVPPIPVTATAHRNPGRHIFILESSAPSGCHQTFQMMGFK